jgi:Domain of unknown function (DUF1844)
VIEGKGKMTEDKKEEKGFKVSDKRRFDTDGEPKSEEEQTTAAAETAAEEKAKPAAGSSVTDDMSTCDGNYQPLPQIDFSTFIMSLSSSAMVHLGLLTDPTTKTQNINLPAAKQTIDILGMMEKKTVNNLTPEEGNLVEKMLFDLRVNFVNICDRHSGKEEANK